MPGSTARISSAMLQVPFKKILQWLSEPKASMTILVNMATLGVACALPPPFGYEVSWKDNLLDM